MRPVQLRLEGFTCFKQEQLVDFHGLELFAISGATGAGKSSLLDAIVYALYGRVPRIGKKGYTEFISLGASRMSARFDFRLADRRYRVTRTARRAGAPSAQIEEVTEEGETIRPLADGVANVDKAVLQVVGLDYDGFIQAVVLPQGDFAKFLKSAPGDRTKLLRDLLRLGRYEEMRRTAQTKSSTAAAEVAHLEKRLLEDYGGATPADITRLEATITNDKESLKELRKRLATADSEVKGARRLRQHTAELEAKRSESAELIGRKDEISDKERQIEAAARAATVAPLLDQVRDRQTRLKEIAKELALAEEGLRRAVDAEAKARGRLEKADKTAARIPDLGKTIERLGEVIGLLEPKNRVEQTVRRLEREREEIQGRFDKLGKERVHTERELENAAKRLTAAERELGRTGYEPKLHEKVSGVLDDATAVGKLREISEQAHALSKEADREAVEAKKDADSGAKRLEASARAAETAGRLAQEAATQLRDAEREHAAEHLRHQLRVGEPCPVCEQSIRSVPKGRKVTDRLGELQREANDAQLRATDLQQKHAELQSDIRGLAKAATAAEKKALKAKEVWTAKAEAYAEAGKRLVSWARRAQIELAEPIEHSLLRLDRELRIKRKAHDEAHEAVISATKHRDDLQRAIEKHDSQITSAREKLERTVEQLKEASEQLKEYLKKIRLVAGEEDPREMRSSLQTEQAALEASRDEARRGVEAASKSVAACQAHVAAGKEHADKAATELQSARNKAEQGVLAAGFESDAAARAALLEEKAVRRLEREVRAFSEAVASLTLRIRELEKELGGQLVSQEALEQKEKDHDDLSTQVETTASAFRVAEDRLRQLRERVHKAELLTLQLEAQREIARVFGALADELQSNRFQQYLLEETVGELVAGASERLRKLSDRYTLVLHEGEFRVIDHDNASEQRSADTLSGGETFLTSLALALELSSQVQNAAGALQLESIFIDEGFGTLDPDTLETVAAAIESLPTGGRMVGIISHIADLTERLPGRIAIDRGSDGSRIRVQT